MTIHFSAIQSRLIDNIYSRFFPDDSQDEEERKVLNLVKTLAESREQEDDEENDRASEDSIDLKDVNLAENPHEEEGEVKEDNQENTAIFHDENDEARSEHDGSKASKAVSDEAAAKTEEEHVEDKENEKSVEGKKENMFQSFKMKVVIIQS